MSEIEDNIVSLLEPFGIGAQEGEIYCLLAQNGKLSALEISRKLAIPRTRVYRLLDKLLAKKLISLVLADNGSKYAASSYKDLEIIVAEKEAQATKLRSLLPLVSSRLGGLWAEEEHRSKVKYYSGLEGLEQVTWNSLNTKGILRTMEVDQDMTAFIDQDLAEKLRQELVDRKIFVRQLTNKKHIKPYTKVAQLVKNYWEVRYLDPEKLPISFEILIYNRLAENSGHVTREVEREQIKTTYLKDPLRASLNSQKKTPARDAGEVYNPVVAMYNFTKRDEFCVEIYNQDFANLMTNIFDLIWAGAGRMKAVGDRGETTLDKS